jgi:hypothetical protein
MRVIALVGLIAIAACSRERANDDSLAAHLADAVKDPAAAVASWKLSAQGWERVTTDPYRREYSYYRNFFETNAAELAAQLGAGGQIATRAHYAGDDTLTGGQARARWAQPVQAPSEVATIGGKPLDAVFVRDDGGWRVIVGVDRLVYERVAAHDIACARRVSGSRSGPCGNAAWVAAEAALKNDMTRLHSSCAQLANLCRGDP